MAPNVTPLRYVRRMRTVQVDDVTAMLTAAAQRYGLTFEEFCTLGADDGLEEPELRDLWLIWGKALQDSGSTDLA